MTELLRLTNSEMSTWRRCRRKWYFSQYRGLKLRHEKVAQSPLSIGTRIHSTLAVLYSNPSMEYDPVSSLHEGIERDIELYPLDEADLRKDEDLCHAMITGYIEWLEETGADADIKVIAPESKLEVELTEGVNLLSKIDTRVERISTGARLAFEFKSVGDLKSPLPTLQIDTQLLTEHLAEFLHLREIGQESERAQGVLYRMLRKVKRTTRANPPFFAEEEVLHSIDELRNHWRHVAAIAHEIQGARQALDLGVDHQTFLYPNPTRNCNWDCPLLGACKLTNADGDVEGYLEEHFEVRDPLERYWDVEQVDE